MKASSMCEWMAHRTSRLPNSANIVGKNGRCRRTPLSIAHIRLLQGLERSESTPAYMSLCKVLRQSQQKVHGEGDVEKVG